jgi:hypothetical protein
MISPVYVESPGRTFYALDINAHFSSIAINADLPTGNYKLLRGHDLNTKLILIENGNFKYAGKIVHGLAFVRAHISQEKCQNSKMVFPLLLQKIRKRSVLALCRKCALTKNESDLCNHAYNERAFLPTVYTLPEIVRGIEVGYDFEYYELLLFEDCCKLLQNFMTVLSYKKQQHATIPVDAQNYIQEINSNNIYDRLGLELKLNDISSNVYKTDLLKSIPNCALGKFGQDEEKYTQTKFAYNKTELVNMFKSGNLLDFIELSPTLCQMSISGSASKLSSSGAASGITEGSRSRNVIIHAYITSLARIVMFDHVQNLLSAPTKFSVRLHLVNADSIYFSCKTDFPVSSVLPMGSKIGQFSNIYNDKIVEFIALAPKAYCFILKNANGSFYHKIKMSGFQQVATMPNYKLTHAMVRQTLNDMIKKQLGSFQVCQVRKEGSKTSSRIKFVHKKHKYTFAFGNARKFKRNIDDDIILYPFGFTTL